MMGIGMAVRPPRSRGPVLMMISALRRLGGTLFYAPDNALGDGAPNLLSAPEDFAGASWVKIACSVTPNAVVAPDGTTTASKLVESNTTTQHYVYQSVALTAGLQYTLTYRAKAGERRRLLLREATASGYSVAFDLLTGTVVGTTGAATGDITPSDNGYYVCRMTFPAVLSGTTVLSAYPLLNSGTTFSDAAYTGDGASGIYIWGAKLEPGSVATAYTPQSVLRTRGVYQDIAGTTPVTAVADLFGLITDKSYGGALGVELVTTPNISLSASGIGVGPALVAGKTYQVAFTVSGYTGTGDCGFDATTFIATTGVTRLSGNGAARGIVVAAGGPVIGLFTRVSNSATFSNISVREVPGNHATQSAVASKPSVQRVPKRLGPNLVVDGSFDDVSKWTAGTGWAVTGGNAVATSAASGVNVLPNAGGYNPTESGKSYKSEVVITAVSAGGVQLIIWNGSTNVANTQTITAPGTYSLTYTATNTQCRPYLSAQGASTSLSAASLSNSEVLEWANVISFDGSNDFLTTGITTGNEGFVAAAVTPADVTATRTVANAGAGGSSTKGFWLYAETGSWIFQVGNGTVRQEPGRIAAVAGVAKVVSAGFDANTVVMEVDSQIVSASRSGDATYTTTPLLLGAYIGGAYSLNGPMHAIAYTPVLPDAATRKIIRNGIAALQGRTL